MFDKKIHASENLLMKSMEERLATRARKFEFDDLIKRFLELSARVYNLERELLLMKMKEMSREQLEELLKEKI